MNNPTGKQVSLTNGAVTAQISQVGAALRAMTVNGVEVVAAFPDDIPAPACAGVILAPWPNRIRDGIWNDNGTTRELAISERKYNNASHGLLRFTAYTIEQESDTSAGLSGTAAATLRADIVPQHGYPYLLETSVTYDLTDVGVDVTHTITNQSDAAAPVALGAHPYFTIDRAKPSELTLRVPAKTRFIPDDRMLPIDTAPAPEALRAGANLGEHTFDVVLTDLDRDADGRARSTLSDTAGRTVTVWQDENFGYVLPYTNTAFPGHEVAVAIEPMTAPTDAFNSGRGVRRLEPGETWTLRWGVEFTG